MRAADDPLSGRIDPSEREFLQQFIRHQMQNQENDHDGNGLIQDVTSDLVEEKRVDRGDTFHLCRFGAQKFQERACAISESPGNESRRNPREESDRHRRQKSRVPFPVIAALRVKAREDCNQHRADRVVEIRRALEDQDDVRQVANHHSRERPEQGRDQNRADGIKVDGKVQKTAQ